MERRIGILRGSFAAIGAVALLIMLVSAAVYFVTVRDFRCANLQASNPAACRSGPGKGPEDQLVAAP
jgi:hypothetical protein